MSINISFLPVTNYKSGSTSKGGSITSHYGDRGSSFHFGIDLKPKVYRVSGDPIIAVQKGIVRVAQYNESYGNYIVIEHIEFGFCSLYSHLSKMFVSVSHAVRGGELIGGMGTTGHSTGVHLHFELINTPYKMIKWGNSRTATQRINPEPFLDFLYKVGKGDMPYSNLSNEQEDDYNYDIVLLDKEKTRFGNALFGRKSRIMIFDSTGKGIDISDFHIIFNCVKTVTLDMSTSNIKIYNLNAETEGKIIEQASRITIEAGYEGLFGLIYDGDIIQGIRGKESATDYYLNVISMDGDRFCSEGFVSQSLTRGMTKRDIVTNVVNKATMPIKIGSISDSFDSTKYIRGKVVFGKANDYLKQLASTQSAQYYIEDGAVNLIKIADTPSGEVLRLDYESGLINSPQQTQDGISFECLLNPKIKLNSMVNIDNSIIVEQQYADGSTTFKLDKSGVYRVIRISFIGDTRGQEWYCRCDAVAQSGKIPSIIANAVSNPY